ncbi:hypothetical protein WMF28_09945 [Sorangium sp. So ce590]|uniref:hypothetical protein n=1 Tax=Sorangium sp. So ce590 TaxID=3133317 RepID=UPI003F5FB0CF
MEGWKEEFTDNVYRCQSESSDRNGAAWRRTRSAFREVLAPVAVLLVRSCPVAVAWLGPMSAAQVAGAELAGVPVVHRTCTGDGSPSCSQIADSWLDGDGRRLPGCRRALRLPAGPLVLTAFSAGGHIVKRLLADPRDRAEVAAVVLADATYPPSGCSLRGFLHIFCPR